jgi:hypothetical protein
LQADAEGKKLINKSAVNVIPKAELENWKKLSQPLFDAWVSDMNSKGHNGKQMLDGAKALIAKHADGK